MAANLEQMRQNFEKAVADYVAAFMERFELNHHDCSWVGDRAGLDHFCFGECWAISLEDMVYVVENNVTFDEYLANIDYCAKCDEYNLQKMNLKSWHSGAPRIPQETFDRLDALKADLEEAIKNEQEKY